MPLTRTPRVFVRRRAFRSRPADDDTVAPPIRVLDHNASHHTLTRVSKFQIDYKVLSHSHTNTTPFNHDHQRFPKITISSSFRPSKICVVVSNSMFIPYFYLNNSYCRIFFPSVPPSSFAILTPIFPSPPPRHRQAVAIMPGMILLPAAAAAAPRDPTVRRGSDPGVLRTYESNPPPRVASGVLSTPIFFDN